MASVVSELGKGGSYVSHSVYRFARDLAFGLCRIPRGGCVDSPVADHRRHCFDPPFRAGTTGCLTADATAAVSDRRSIGRSDVRLGAIGDALGHAVLRLLRPHSESKSEFKGECQ